MSLLAPRKAAFYKEVRSAVNRFAACPLSFCNFKYQASTSLSLCEAQVSQSSKPVCYAFQYHNLQKTLGLWAYAWCMGHGSLMSPWSYELAKQSGKIGPAQRALTQWTQTAFLFVRI